MVEAAVVIAVLSVVVAWSAGPAVREHREPTEEQSASGVERRHLQQNLTVGHSAAGRPPDPALLNVRRDLLR